MRRVLVSHLKPGMRLGRPVYGFDGQLYLNEGITLKSAYIDTLKRHEFREVYVIDERIADIQIQDIISEQTRHEAIQRLKDIIKEEKGRSSPSRSLVLHKHILKQSVDNIISELLNQSNLLFNLIDIRQQDTYTFHHSVNVCALSLVNGIGLGLNRRKLDDLGIGAITHDIGKVCVPLHILNKPAALTPEEFSLVKEHARYGYEVIGDQDCFGNDIKSIVYQHHERIDGSDYPNGLVEKKINYLAKVVSVSDVYDALIADRPYRPAYKPHVAVEMLHASIYYYDADILKSFFNHVAAFPIGTAVKLNNGYVGIVIKNKVGLTLRPKIRIINSKNYSVPASPLEIDLSKELDLVVVDVLDDI